MSGVLEYGTHEHQEALHNRLSWKSDQGNLNEPNVAGLRYPLVSTGEANVCLLEFGERSAQVR
jgi:hypothetical protein